MTEHRDLLQRWLSGEGAAVLDRFTAEAMDVVGVIDRRLIVRYVNWTAPGLTPEGVVGVPAVDLAPPTYRDMAERSYKQVLETGKGTRFEVMYEDDAQVLLWDVRVGPIRSDGEVIGLLTISTDVTEERRAQVDRDRFFSLSLDMLVVSSPDGLFKRVNPAFGEALGYETSELIGMHFTELLHPDDLEHASVSFQELMGGTPVTSENRLRRKDGQYRTLSWRATTDPITNDAYAVARDITDQRAIEERLRRAQKMEAVGQLAGGIAHDFNNLMQAILGNIDLGMMEEGTSHVVVQCLKGIEGAANRAAALTRQLLAFSRRQALNPVPVDLAVLIQGLSEILRGLLPANIRVELELQSDLALVNADPGQLEQVVMNLCVNARDAMAAGGRLAVEAKNVVIDERDLASRPWARAGRFVLLRVSDTGVGMATSVRERIFEPFYTTKGAQQGTGLGLATVYGIVEQHEGLIQVDSEVGRGSVFEVYLPAHARTPYDEDTQAPSEPEQGKETILVAEDEEAVRRVLVLSLQRAGYRVLEAHDGRQAVQALRERDADQVSLALLDVVMPELGGPDAWQQMQALRPDLRVLFVSGYADGRHLERLPQDACVIKKPFRREELLRRVREALEGTPAVRP